MSSENDEVVAGHPPAGEHFEEFFPLKYIIVHGHFVFIPVKVGGMRVASRPKHHEQDADAYDEKYEESLPE